MSSREVQALRSTRQSLEAVDTALQAMLGDLGRLADDYEAAAKATRGWAAILGKPVPLEADVKQNEQQGAANQRKKQKVQ